MPVEELAYVEEHGPGIPELPAPGERAADAPPATGTVLPALDAPQWDQNAIEAFLKGTGSAVHWMWGVGEHDWRMTEEDLERIAPPLTRICNRYEPLLKMAPIADPLLVAHGFALWGWRSALERQRALRDREAGQTPAGERYVRTDDEEQTQPVAGRDWTGREPQGEPIAPEDVPEHHPYFANGGSE